MSARSRCGRCAGRQSHAARPTQTQSCVKSITKISSISPPSKTELRGYDACFFCLGVTSAGMTEASYHRVTYDIALAAAQTLAKLNPAMTFIYISGLGTDSTEKGTTMWARVKGQTENALQRLPFKAALHVSPRIHPTAARDQIKNEFVQGDVRRSSRQSTR